MLKTLGSQIKEFKKDSVLTPIFMILEVVMETIIPFLMASIIDDGVEKGDIHHIYVVGGCMYGSHGSTGTGIRCFGRQVRSQSICWFCQKSEKGDV